MSDNSLQPLSRYVDAVFEHRDSAPKQIDKIEVLAEHSRDELATLKMHLAEDDLRNLQEIDAGKLGVFIPPKTLRAALENNPNNFVVSNFIVNLVSNAVLRVTNFMDALPTLKKDGQRLEFSLDDVINIADDSSGPKLEIKTRDGFHFFKVGDSKLAMQHTNIDGQVIAFAKSMRDAPPAKQAIPTSEHVAGNQDGWYTGSKFLNLQVREGQCDPHTLEYPAVIDFDIGLGKEHCDQASLSYRLKAEQLTEDGMEKKSYKIGHPQFSDAIGAVGYAKKHMGEDFKASDFI